MPPWHFGIVSFCHLLQWIALLSAAPPPPISRYSRCNFLSCFGREDKTIHWISENCLIHRFYQNFLGCTTETLLTPASYQTPYLCHDRLKSLYGTMANRSRESKVLFLQSFCSDTCSEFHLLLRHYDSKIILAGSL
jgi:hypothetical protein